MNKPQPSKSDSLTRIKNGKLAREKAISDMLMACCEALQVTNDLEEVAFNLHMLIGSAMNASRHDPKALGEYLIEQGLSLSHPDALKKGPHFSRVAYTAKTSGLFPALDEIHDQLSKRTSELLNQRRPSTKR